MANKMVGRVVKAIQHEFPLLNANDCKFAAITAITAMREPTADMVADIILDHGILPGNAFWADVWNTAIASALRNP